MLNSVKKCKNCIFCQTSEAKTAYPVKGTETIYLCLFNPPVPDAISEYYGLPQGVSQGYFPKTSGNLFCSKFQENDNV